jgi:LAO/AO transport system kinase
MSARPCAPQTDAIVAGVLARDPRAIGRAISAVERGEGFGDLLRQLYPRTGSARIVGITGPPGAGKSTLVARLAQALRRQGHTVGIVAVDPSSPFTGGAILGDRIRMGEISEV